MKHSFGSRWLSDAGVSSLAVAQQAAKHVLSSDELKKAVPTEYFFRGQKAPVQLRNAVGIPAGGRQDDVGRAG